MRTSRNFFLLGLIGIFCHPSYSRAEDELAKLREQVAQQQTQINELRAALAEQKEVLDRVLKVLPAAGSGSTGDLQRDGGGESTKTARANAFAPVAPSSSEDPQSVSSAEVRQYMRKVDELGKLTESTARNLGGFRFSGDLRLRLDATMRSGNNIAPPLQNIRGRYRLRLNIDKDLDPRFRFHLQLSTGPFNNGLSNDQDFSGIVAKHPFSIAEAYMDFHPGSRFSVRGGRMEEVFADSSRFLWDNDVHFNGFQQIVRFPLEGNALGIKSIEFRSGEYILTNPNIVVLSPTSPFVSAGYQPGQKVRAADLFHPGVVVRGDLSPHWSHQFISDVEIYRNPRQILLSTMSDGFPVLVSNSLGVALSGPLTGSGNGTTTPGGAIYSAPHFQIVRAAYRLEHEGWKFGDRSMPFWLDFQASRNTGTSKLRDAFMVSANLGAVKKFGDMRFLYQFALKDANSLIAQFTDNELGIGTGVNMSAHALRFDLGLTRFLQWQNLFFFQDPRRPSNPAEQFFVPLQPGANTMFRYQGQLAFTF
jgi:hypothetical protein